MYDIMELKNPLKSWYVLSKYIGITSFVPYMSGNVFCPFHRDENKPSAVIHIYDEDGIEKLQCYACGKTYTSYHYVKLVLSRNPVDYIIENIPTPVVEGLLKSSNVIVTEVTEEAISSIKEIYLKYKEPLVFLNNLYLSK